MMCFDEVVNTNNRLTKLRALDFNIAECEGILKIKESAWWMIPERSNTITTVCTYRIKDACATFNNVLPNGAYRLFTPESPRVTP